MFCQHNILSLDPIGYDFVDVILAFGFCKTVELFVNLPLVQQMADRHQPDLLLGSVKEGYAIKNQPGKQLLVAYPTCAFFEDSSSLSILRFVPLNIASIMQFL